MQHQIVVAAPSNSRLHQEASAIAGVTTLNLNFRNRLHTTLRACWILRKLVVLHAIDIVHVNGSADHRTALFAFIGMGQCRPRIIFTKHNDLPVTGLMSWLKARLATDAVICVCEYVKSTLLKNVYKKCPLHVVYNGVDLKHYAIPDRAAIARSRAQWLQANETHVLAIGSNAGTANYKGWLDLVEAVALLEAPLRAQIRILLAGELPCPTQQAQVAALGMSERVTFTGLLSDVRLFIAGLDVGFVLSHQESISFACREMMAMGKPVLISNVGGLPDNVEANVSGWITAARDPLALAILLQEILSQRHRLPAMGVAARTKAEQQFSLDTFIAATLQVYHNTLQIKH